MCYSRLFSLNRKPHSIALLMFGVLQLVFGCATIGGGTSQKVQINSDPIGATVTFSPSGDAVVTPAAINLDRSIDHVATVHLDGYEDMQLRINREQNGAVFGSALIPFVGPIALAVDAASDAEFKLSPDPVTVVLAPTAAGPQPKLENSDGNRVMVFNRNTVTGRVQFAFDGAEPCKLDRWQMTSVALTPGPHTLLVYHWDLFKFQNEYDIDMPTGAQAIGILSGIGSTHFSYYDELPSLKEPLEMISCDDLVEQETAR